MDLHSERQRILGCPALVRASNVPGEQRLTVHPARCRVIIVLFDRQGKDRFSPTGEKALPQIVV